jgi:hypothetical protein
MPLFFNKLICGLLITLLVVPTALFVAPKQAEAMPTMDPNTLMLVIKEYILDIIGWVMSELLLALTTSEIAEWANNNFGGMVLTYNEATGTFNYEWVNNDASFLASPDKFFTNLALGVGMHALEGTSPTFQTIFPDWDSTMLISLREDLMRLEQSFEERYRPTMDAADLENLFANLGEGGGWSAWLEMATNPQNNIHGALRLAREEATRQIQIAQSQTRDDLQQGGGFLTARNCVDVQPNHPDADIFGCLRYENVTPGSAIRGQVGQALGIDLEKKAQADEITEVIAQFIAGALLNLIEQGLSTIGSSTLSTYPITTSGSPEHSCPSTMNAEQCQAYLMEQAQAERERQIEEAREEYERERDRVVDEIRQPGDPGYVEPITQRTLTLTAQATSASNIHLSWTTNAPDGTEFQIFRRDSAGNFVQLPGSTDTSQTTTPLHRYVDARLNPNSTYTYFVKSVDGTYSSAEVSATTSHLNSTDHTQIMAALTNVSSFRANTVESNSVTLTWGSLPGHTFRIYRNGQRITEAVAGSMSFVDESVAHSTTYRYSITAVLEGQETRMSPPVAVTTPLGTTTPPPSGGTYGARDVQRSKTPTSTDVFVSPTGSGTSCTQTAPCNLQTGVSRGGFIWLLDGTYNYNGQLSVGSGKTIEAYNPKMATIDFGSSSGSRISLGDSNVLRNIIVRRANDVGVIIFGNNNFLHGVISEYNRGAGFQTWPSSGYTNTTNPTGGSFNNITDCIARFNNDCPSTSCTDSGADGISLSAGRGNRIIHFSAYGNSDDGIDLWASYQSTVMNSVSYDNGFTSTGTQIGNGMQFKLGSSRALSGYTPEPNQHTVVNNWAYGRAASYFTRNGGSGYLEISGSVCTETMYSCDP